MMEKMNELDKYLLKLKNDEHYMRSLDENELSEYYIEYCYDCRNYETYTCTYCKFIRDENPTEYTEKRC